MIETRCVSLNGLEFTVDIAGHGNEQTVLLLHGFPESRYMWHPQVEALSAAGFRVIAPDQRGYSTGARPAEQDSYRVELIVQDAADLMQALGIADFHLVGHDWGGQIAWLLASAHPDRIRTLSILSRPHPAAFARAMAEDPEQPERSRHHRFLKDPDAYARMRIDGLRPLREALETQHVPPEIAAVHIAKLAEPGGVEGAINWYRASGFTGAETPSIDLPTLYIWGTEDATVGRYAAELTSDYVTGPFRFVTVAGAGHFIVDQCPDIVSNLLLDHIRQGADSPA
nr:alpha/beta hydrolase [Sphingomonas sp. CDS-1]